MEDLKNAEDDDEDQVTTHSLAQQFDQRVVLWLGGG